MHLVLIHSGLASHQNTAPFSIAGNVNVTLPFPAAPSTFEISPKNGRKYPCALLLPATSTRTFFCGVCTGFTPPRNPAKFAKNTCGVPSTCAIDVASAGEANTCIELEGCNLSRNVCSLSGVVAAKSLLNAAKYS